MGIYSLEQSQKIPSSIEKVWDFISSPKNLKEITPPHMGFDIITKNLPEKMYPGMIVGYKVSPILGIKLTWITEISQVKEYEYFVDEQRIGPYTLWHHQHFISKIEGGVLMQDIVNYVPPMGILGDIANSILIKGQLKEIFDFRTKKVIEVFGEFK